MTSKIRTAAIFDSDAFNLTEPKDYFINPICFGDDLALWLLGKLEERDFVIDKKPGQEDFGWYILYEVDGIPYCVVIGGYEETRWWIEIERHLGFLGSLTGGRKRNISDAAVKAIHDILATAPEIKNLAWYGGAEFKKGIIDESTGAPAP